MSSIKMPSPQKEEAHRTHHIGYFLLMIVAVVVGVFVHPMMGFAVVGLSLIISSLFKTRYGLDTLDGDQDGN